MFSLNKIVIKKGWVAFSLLLMNNKLNVWRTHIKWNDWKNDKIALSELYAILTSNLI